MPVIFQKFIFRVDLQTNTDVIYLFGDNMERWGMGGQAKEMRNEPNAVGVATKRTPTSGTNAYFDDEDYDEVMRVMEDDMKPAFEHVRSGGIVVIPFDGLGTGLSELPQRAPHINDGLTGLIEDLIDAA